MCPPMPFLPSFVDQLRLVRTSYLKLCKEEELYLQVRLLMCYNFSSALKLHYQFKLFLIVRPFTFFWMSQVCQDAFYVIETPWESESISNTIPLHTVKRLAEINGNHVNNLCNKNVSCCLVGFFLTFQVPFCL